MTPRCPTCRRDLPLADVDVGRDTAHCRRCGGTFSFAELASGDGRPDAIEPLDLPSGTWLTPTFDGFEVGVSTRSPNAGFLVPFLCLLSGGLILGISISPPWSWRLNLPMVLSSIPFTLLSVFLLSQALMAIAGKVVLSVSGDEGRVFVGVGSLGRTRDFAWSGVTRIVEGQAFHGGRSRSTIVLEGSNRLVLDGFPDRERHDFMLQTLRAQLLASGPRRLKPAGGP